MTIQDGEHFFAILESVDLGTCVNPRIRLFHDLYEKIGSLRSWEPRYEDERCILRGFKIHNEHSEAFSIFFCLDLNCVEIHDKEESQRLFMEFATEQLKRHYVYAYTKKLNGKTIKEIREIAKADGIRLPSRARKHELIEEFGR